MCGNPGLISRPDPSFSFLSSQYSLSTTRNSIGNPFTRTHFPTSPFSTQPIRIGSFKLRARASTINSVPPLSLYEILGIPETVTVVEVKQAYKQLARKYHPDVSPPDRVEEYTQRFIQVQEAYETLSDPERRALYDRDMAKGIHLAFSGRNRFETKDEEKSGWKKQWESQVSELKRRSMYKKSSGNMSWAARMRMQTRNES